MGIEVRDDTIVTSAMPAGSWVIGGQTSADAAPTAFGRESIYNYISSALAAVASSGSASDLDSGTLPLGRLHSHLQDISNILAAAQGDILHFDGSNWVALSPGTAGHVLTTGGAGADVSWSPAGAGDMYAADNLAYLTDLAVARSNLGLTIGADVQAYDATLASLSALGTAADKIAYTTSIDTWAETAITTFGRSLIDDADASAAQTTLGLVPGINVQAYDAGLDDIAALAVTDGNVIVGNGTNWVAESGATARASLGLTIGTNVQAYAANLDSWSAVAPSAYTTVANLAATTTGNGSALVGIEDAGAYFSGSTVESALQYLGSAVAALDQAVVLKGTWDASAGTFPGAGAAQAGWSYIVSVDGTVDGTDFVAGDRIVAIADNASTTVYASNWLKLDYTDRVSSVAGRTGAVTLAQADVSGLTTADSPQFAGVNIGHASDTTLTRVSAGVAAIEGSNILLASSIGSTVQAYDAELAAIAGLTSAADKVPYFTGSGTAAIADFSAAGRSMAGAASATAQTALLDAFTGDSGAGGVKGLVPAPATGDAAASKFLKADGTWAAPSGSGDLLAANNLSDVSNVSTARLNLGVAPDSPQGRLTLTTGTPVLTSTVSGATTIYYTPYRGQHVPLYDGTRWSMHDVGGELSQATTDTTKSPAACTTDSNYDLFVWVDSGTYRCTRGPAWSSSTARGTGAGTTELEYVNGVLVNKIAITNGPAAQRGTYAGTIRTNASSQVDYIVGGTSAGGTAAVIGVWNAYNRVVVPCGVSDSTSSWTYNSTTIRNMNNSAGNRVSMVRGLDEDGVIAVMNVTFSGGASGDYVPGIGIDGAVLTAAGYGSFGSLTAPGSVSYAGLPGLGWHYLQATEKQVTTASSAQIFGVISSIQMHRLSVEMRA